MLLVLKTVGIIIFAVEAVCRIGPCNVNITDLLKYKCSEKLHKIIK